MSQQSWYAIRVRKADAGEMTNELCPVCSQPVQHCEKFSCIPAATDSVQSFLAFAKPYEKAMDRVRGGAMLSLLRPTGPDDLKAAEDRAKREAEAAVIRERERAARERKTEEMARAKREADAKLRDAILADISADLYELSPKEGATKIMDGLVRHVRVVF